MPSTEQDWVAISTSGVAVASGCSVQQVRNLEASGVIPPATRSGNGYRRFTTAHVRALVAYRDLAHAVGPVDAWQTLRMVRSLPTEQAVALIGGLHSRLSAEREHTLAARAALQSIHTEAATDAGAVADDSMTITALSGALGVRASTLRFWESVDLVTPERIATRAGSARRYPPHAVREARITATLRAGGYRIPDVQQALTAIRELHDASHSLAALDARLETIADRSLALLRADTLLAELIDAEQ